jgi:hypothetical protein
MSTPSGTVAKGKGSSLRDEEDGSDGTDRGRLVHLPDGPGDTLMP